MEVEAVGCDRTRPVVQIPVELPYDAVPTSYYTLNIEEMKLSITFVVPKDSNPGDKVLTHSQTHSLLIHYQLIYFPLDYTCY